MALASHRLGTATLAILLPFIAACSASAQLYISAAVAGDNVLLRLDDGELVDVTVSTRSARDMDTDVEGRILAIADGGVYRWDVEAETEELLGDVSYVFSALAPTLDGGVVVGDGALGVRLLAPDGLTRWLIEDPDGLSPPPEDQVRYQGVQVDPLAGSAGKVYVLRRPFRCARMPTVLLEIGLDEGSVPTETGLLVEAHQQALSVGTLVIPEFGCPDGAVTLFVDTNTGGWEAHAAPETAWTSDMAVTSDGAVYRVVERSRIERLDAVARAWVPFLEPPVDRVWSIAPVASLLDRTLDCPRDNHGHYVSCVARRTQQLVKSGALTRAQRQELLRIAAQSAIGKTTH